MPSAGRRGRRARPRNSGSHQLASCGELVHRRWRARATMSRARCATPPASSPASSGPRSPPGLRPASGSVGGVRTPPPIAAAQQGCGPGRDRPRVRSARAPSVAGRGGEHEAAPRWGAVRTITSPVRSRSASAGSSAGRCSPHVAPLSGTAPGVRGVRARSSVTQAVELAEVVLDRRGGEQQAGSSGCAAIRASSSPRAAVAGPGAPRPRSPGPSGGRSSAGVGLLPGAVVSDAPRSRSPRHSASPSRWSCVSRSRTCSPVLTHWVTSAGGAESGSGGRARGR